MIRWIIGSNGNFEAGSYETGHAPMKGDRRRGCLAMPRGGVAGAPAGAVDARGTAPFHAGGDGR